MAKKVLLDVLEQTIGKYVQNLDAESLNVAVWSGKIVLKDLQLNVDAVNAELDRQAVQAPNLAVPLKVLSGHFGHFQVDVPWASLTSQSVVLRAEGLEVEVEPYDRLSKNDPLAQAMSESARSAKIQQARIQSIATSEKYRKQAYAVRQLTAQEEEEEEDGSGGGTAKSHSSPVEPSTFRSRLVRRILENLQIEISRVHISLVDKQGTAGVVLDRLSLVTTDASGQPVYVDRTKDNNRSFLHKALLLQGLGIYLDHEESATEKYVTAKTSLSSIRESTSTSSNDQQDETTTSSSSSGPPPMPAPAPILPHSYVLAPLSFQAQLRQADNQRSIDSEDVAKYRLTSELSSLTILLSRKQLELARHIQNEIVKDSAAGNNISTPLFPEYRPLTRITDGPSAQQWWKYAVRCIGRLNGRRSWVEFFMAYKKRQQYIPLYKRHAHASEESWLKPLTTAEQATLQELEHDRTISIEGVMAWRNIADGQVDKELQKRKQRQKGKGVIQPEAPKSYFSSIFGSSSSPKKSSTNPGGKGNNHDNEDDKEDEPPIQLTTEELKELEDMSKEQFEDASSSWNAVNDSKLYDVRFVWNALKIHLTSWDMRHIAALELGTVAANFHAAPNGAFGFQFDLDYLEIQDRITTQSFFPSVLRNIGDRHATTATSSSRGKSNSGADSSKKSDSNSAFYLELSKNKTGDQSLKAKLAALEVVASQQLFRELVRFFSPSTLSSSPNGPRAKKNPILTQSLSGSIDLFYDADQGEASMMPTTKRSKDPNTEETAARGGGAQIGSDLSKVLTDAWKKKTANKAAWMMDVDIQAPVVLIPEKCNDPRAKILVIDLGHLKLSYGKISPSERVAAWFQEHPRTEDSDVTFDSGNLAINDLTFKVGRVNDWRLETGCAVGEDTDHESSVIDPISLSLDVGVENATRSAEHPRICGIGVIPTIMLRMSPTRGSKIFAVVGAWTQFIADIIEGQPAEVGLDDDSQIEENESAALPSDTSASTDEDARSEGALSEGTSEQPQVYFVIGLQKLSVIVSLDARDRVEAHLVSVYTSLQLMNDSSLVVGVRMGWFWILDRLETKHTRRQRLLAHSKLPTPADSFAQDDDQYILSELKDQGAFGADFGGSTDLADISYRKIGSNANRLAKKRGELYVETMLDATFSSLFIHWNPYAVTSVYGLVDRFYDLANEYEDTSTLIASPEKAPRARRLGGQAEKGKQMGQMQIQARMHRLDLNLNSARDDLPFFILTVAQTEVDMLSSQGNKEASLSLGDIRIRTPDDMGETLPAYRTLLGLAAGSKESLLTVKYFQGRDAVNKAGLSEEDSEKLEAFAEVDLSPMRLLFIQSQIMALVEYSTEGILGSLASKAASSAAQKAKELADSVDGKKLFRVSATALDLVLPQAAYSENTIRIYVGSVHVEYFMLPGTEGSQADVELADVFLHDTNGERMQEKPIRMSLNVILPAGGIGTIDDQAMRVDIQMSEASFLLQRTQYLQLLRTLEENTGEVELFLRDESFIDSSRAVSPQGDGESQVESTNILTHAGNPLIEKQRRLYLKVAVEVLALQLCDSALDPIIRLAAVKADISFQSHPDKAKTFSKVSLRNLVCEDRRQKAATRQYRFLVGQSGESTHENEDLFFVGFESGKNETSLELKVGSPRVVLIPDAISEVLAFVRSDAKDDKITPKTKQEVDATKSSAGRGLDSISAGESGDVEVGLVETGETCSRSVSASTKTCRIVLVDLGSHLSKDPSRNAQLTETVVLQGIFSASMKSKSDSSNGKLIESEFDGHADEMEIFCAFGREMRSPLQILEPSAGSAHGSTKATPYGGSEIEIRAAALTPLEFTFSMHNAALLSAIVNSLQVSFMSGENLEEQAGIDLQGLTKGQTEHIQNLATELESPSDRSSGGHTPTTSSSVAGDGSFASYDAAENTGGTKIQVKLTMPQTKLTFINDLQGLDEALFRTSVTTFVAGLEVDRAGMSNMTFDFHVNTSVLADYFDTSCNIWNSLLVQPWEINLKALRAPSKRFKSDRLSTTIDLESFPCYISFSEQFLVSLTSASRMWSIYSVAMAVHVDEDNTSSGSARASMAASAARNLITSRPYAIENHTGEEVMFSLPGEQETGHPCDDGSIQYFRFEPPRGAGYGGRRTYGQDLEFEKTVKIHWSDETTTSVGHLDFEFGLPSKTHKLKNGVLVTTHVVKEGKTTVLHLTSHASVVNNTSLSFEVSLEDGIQGQSIGTCVAYNLKRGNDTPLTTSQDGIASKDSKSFSVPAKLLSAYHRCWETEQRARLNLSITPVLPDEGAPRLSGIISIDVSRDELKKSSDGRMISKFDVVCKPSHEHGRVVSPLVVQVVLKTSFTADNYAQIDICLEPRALIENKFPVPVKLRTPMPHTFSSAPHEEMLGNDIVYSLETGDRVEVFTAGPSIALTLKTAASPIAGCDIDWMDGGWIDLPLVSEFSLFEPVRCLLPFTGNTHDLLSANAQGSEFFIAEGAQALADLAAPGEEGKKHAGPQKAEQKMASPNPDAPLRTFYATVCYYGIDHTGDVLFEQVLRSDPTFKATMDDALDDSMKESRRHSRRQSTSQQIMPFCAFASSRHHRRITLLPSGNVPLRILQMTMEGDGGYRRSLPFFVEELPLGEGGVSTIPILWESKKQSGYYAYRSIVNEHQSEIHIVPEFLIFNGSKQIVLVKERAQPEVIVEGGEVSRLGVDTRQNGLEIALYFVELDCRTSFMRVDKLGIKVAILKNIEGVTVGSLCVQTVIDTLGESRLVVKIGEIQTGTVADGSQSKMSMLSEDFFRFRVRWTELQLILNELQKPEYTTRGVGKAFSQVSMSASAQSNNRNLPAHELPKTIKTHSTTEESKSQSSDQFNYLPQRNTAGDTERRKAAEILQQPLASIIFSRFTFDFQRVFKENDTKAPRGVTTSPERSQISLIVHNVIMKDLTPDSAFPMVFDSSSPNISFFDLCVRVRGPLDAAIVKVDLFDLNLAHSNGASERIKITTSEDYVWRLIDLSHRIMEASGDFAGYGLTLEEDEEHGGFIVKMEQKSKLGLGPETEYTPPRSDTLFDINMARVSPFCLLVSFKRNPQTTRYKNVHSGDGGSAMMNYISRRLKFTIDRAELNFARYEDRSLKGPPDRLFENLFAVYMSRMKFKLVTLLTSASLQDWKFLADRGRGDDEYVEGDILRAAGNLTGKASNLIFKRVGQTVGDGVSDFTRRFGDTIESTSDKIGAGRVGAGVNTVISGVGDGFGSALTGVGSGTGKIFKGAGQGMGHAFGGVTGGALKIGKGIGKGITKGDGRAVWDGFSEGVSSVGGGFATGAESAVVGAADGLLSAGKGLFSGVKSVGKGIGGAFTGKKPERKDHHHHQHHHDNNQKS